MARYTDYLIIGNSAAGITAADTLRSAAPDSSILIISREPYSAYGRPLISYLIDGATTREVMGFKSDTYYADHSIDALLGPDYEATALSAERHEVTLANGEVIAYGKCLVATGSVPFVPPIPGIKDRSNVYGFLTLDDAQSAWQATLEAREQAELNQRPLRVIVIGGGLIGLKAAEALSHHADEVVVLELMERILPAVLDNDGAALVQEALLGHGIVCKPGVSAEELCGDGDRVEKVKLTNGEELDCDLVIAAVGVRPATTLAAEAGAATGRGLIVDERLQTSLPDVYAAGDAVQVTDRLDGSEHPLALWPNAMRQGRIAALAMADPASPELFRDSFAVNAVDFFDLSLLTAGLINPPDDAGCEVRYRVDGHTYAKFVIRDDRLVGYILLNQPDGAGIYTSLIEDAVPLSTLDPWIFDGPPQALSLPARLRWERYHKGYPDTLDHRGWATHPSRPKPDALPLHSADKAFASSSLKNG